MPKTKQKLAEEVLLELGRDDTKGNREDIESVRPD